MANSDSAPESPSPSSSYVPVDSMDGTPAGEPGPRPANAKFVPPPVPRWIRLRSWLRRHFEREEPDQAEDSVDIVSPFLSLPKRLLDWYFRTAVPCGVALAYATYARLWAQANMNDPRGWPGLDVLVELGRSGAFWVMLLLSPVMVLNPMIIVGFKSIWLSLGALLLYCVWWVKLLREELDYWKWTPAVVTTIAWCGYLSTGKARGLGNAFMIGLTLACALVTWFFGFHRPSRQLLKVDEEIRRERMLRDDAERLAERADSNASAVRPPETTSTQDKSNSE